MELAIHTVSVDEMTGIQALERIAATKLMMLKQVERREFEYKRHGTQCLTGNLEVATGKVISPTVQTTRTEKDFAEHIARTVASDAAAGWIFILDNLTTHVSESLVRYVAKECDLEEDLGVKREKGDPEIGGNTAKVSGERGASDPFRLCAKAYVVDESDRDLVQYFGASGDQAGKLYLDQGSA